MNEQNLRTLSTEEAREIGRKGGIRSGEARRERKAIRVALEEVLSMPCECDGQAMTGVEAIAVRTFQKAMDGDIRAIAFIRDTIGEMPSQRVEVEKISPETYAEVEALLLGDDGE